jgi:hypothetical protein
MCGWGISCNSTPPAQSLGIFWGHVKCQRRGFDKLQSSFLDPIQALWASAIISAFSECQLKFNFESHLSSISGETWASWSSENEGKGNIIALALKRSRPQRIIGEHLEPECKFCSDLSDVRWRKRAWPAPLISSSIITNSRFPSKVIRRLRLVSTWVGAGFLPLFHGLTLKSLVRVGGCATGPMRSRTSILRHAPLTSAVSAGSESSGVKVTPVKDTWHMSTSDKRN